MYINQGNCLDQYKPYKKVFLTYLRRYVLELGKGVDSMASRRGS